MDTSKEIQNIREILTANPDFKTLKALIDMAMDTDEDHERQVNQAEFQMNESIIKANRFLFAEKMHTDKEYREQFLKENKENYDNDRG